MRLATLGRLLLMLLAFSGNLHATLVEDADPKIEILGKSQFAFDLDGSRISVEIRDRVLREKRDILLDWVVYSAKAVLHYYGRFPVRSVHIDLLVTDGPAVRFGRAFGGEAPMIRINVGEDINPEMLRRDWVLVHEMVHLAMADVPQQHAWLLEGLATYVESIARAQHGQLTEDQIWRYFIERMPQGLPKDGDRGLDNTPTWGRTYWGGAIFCMLADIEIRNLTDNRKSLREALRGVLDAGLSMHASSTAMEVFEAGDRATGVAVLVPLYLKMKADPHPVDLDTLWASLGVTLENQQVVYNDQAPMAHIRKRLLKS
ncbi:MAG: hypothetical protein GWP56_08425 [Gammaproteobacteria bacterium]|nr:hypothetical protein [Gammaproteobacteria bacterium]